MLKKGFPRRGELVIGTVTKIDNFGAYINLSDYGKEGFIPRVEVASVWVKDIKHFIKENQRVVAKVIRVNPSRGLIDLSLKAVKEREAIKTLQEWKRRRKGIYLLKEVAKRTNQPIEEIYIETGKQLEQNFGDILAAFESIVYEGPQTIKQLKIPGKMKEAIIEVANKHVEIPEVTLSRYVKIISYESNGVEIIKNALIKAKMENEEEGYKTEITNVGSPLYKIKVTANDFKKAENKLREMIETLRKEIKGKNNILEVTERKEAKKGA